MVLLIYCVVLLIQAAPSSFHYAQTCSLHIFSLFLLKIPISTSVGTAGSEQACTRFGYIWTPEEACGYVVKILCNRLCSVRGGVLRFVLESEPVVGRSFTHCLLYIDPVLLGLNEVA